MSLQRGTIVASVVFAASLVVAGMGTWRVDDVAGLLKGGPGTNWRAGAPLPPDHILKESSANIYGSPATMAARAPGVPRRSTAAHPARAATHAGYQINPAYRSINSPGTDCSQTSGDQVAPYCACFAKIAVGGHTGTPIFPLIQSASGTKLQVSAPRTIAACRHEIIHAPRTSPALRKTHF